MCKILNVKAAVTHTHQKCFTASTSHRKRCLRVTDAARTPILVRGSYHKLGQQRLPGNHHLMLAARQQGTPEVKLHLPLHERGIRKGDEQRLVCRGKDPAQT